MNILINCNKLPGLSFSISLDIFSENTFYRRFTYIDPLSGVSLNISWERFGKRILSLFDVALLCGHPRIGGSTIQLAQASHSQIDCYQVQNIQAIAQEGYPQSKCYHAV